MRGYWTRHRLLPTAILSIVVALMTGLLFAFPHVHQLANDYNSQSIYKNTEIDFIAPEPSFDQVSQLPGTDGIKKVFPFYLTKTQVGVNGTSRTATVLLSDQFTNVDITMFNESRLIEKSDVQFDNPVLVDWLFCHETSASVGDTVSFSIDGKSSDYTIYAVYETNTIYDGGTLLVQISAEQREAINQKSANNGYSGMYISADDYAVCRSYLTTEYRPLGRLKDRGQFESDEQYQIHYDAVMNSGYANEITDFRVREDSLSKAQNNLMIWVGAVLAAVIVFAFDMAMAKRGCEKNYFTKVCIPQGLNTKPYYTISFWAESISIIALYATTLAISVHLADEFIPRMAYSMALIATPIAVIVAGASCCFVVKRSLAAETIKYEKAKAEAADKRRSQKDGVSLTEEDQG